MIEKLIELSIRNRYLVMFLAAALTVCAVYAVLDTPMDAVPDLGENQVIVFTDWMGRSPREIEDQVTYPLSLKLQGLAGVKTVRSTSEFNFSMITIIFDDKVDFYFARQRVLEKLALAATFMPSGVVPYLAPDATAVGQIFWYTVEGGNIDEGRRWALQKYYIGPELSSVPGVAEVGTVGGKPQEYQIDVDPSALRAYGITLGELHDAVARSNSAVGGRVIQKNNAEYVVRGVGWIESVRDIENTVVKEAQGTPIYVKNLATVQLGTQFRRGVFEKDGNEVAGGVVLMRHGENPLAVTERVKKKIQELQAALPPGVRIVPAYDRTNLIHGAIHTLTEVMWHEMVIAAVAILLILMHFRSVFVIAVTLPLSVLFSFLMMWLLRRLGIVDVQANIMSLAGITISIGILVDQAIVMVENATHRLKEHFGDKEVTGNTVELIIPACRLVGRPIFFSVLIILISFIPVFALSGREGKYFHPMAFTKSLAMVGVALISVTLVPALIPTFIKGRLRSEEENWIVHSFISIYKPVLQWALPRRNLVMWLFAVLLILAAGMFPMQAVLGLGAAHWAWRIAFFVVLAVVVSITVLSIRGGSFWAFGVLFACAAGLWLLANLQPVADIFTYETFFWYLMVIILAILRAIQIPLVVIVGLAVIVLFFWKRQWQALAFLSLVMIGFWAYDFRKIGVVFMPALNEGTVMDMPVTVPRASITQTADDLKARDAILRGFPEVESVIGKAGRADTATDPAPLEMVETFVNYRPRELWPKRVMTYNDATGQVRAMLGRLEDRGFVTQPAKTEDRDSLINDVTMLTLTRFDEFMRTLALQRYREFEDELGPDLTRFVIEETIRHFQRAGVLVWPAAGDEQVEVDRLVQALTPSYGSHLAKNPALEDVTKLCQETARSLAALRALQEKGSDGQPKDVDPARALSLQGFSLKKVWAEVGTVLGAEPKTLEDEVLATLKERRLALWRERISKQINWELFDRGVEAFTWAALEELGKAAADKGLFDNASHGKEYKQFGVEVSKASPPGQDSGSPLPQGEGSGVRATFVALRQELAKPFATKLLLWRRQGGPKGDLLQELDTVLQVPGWSNIWTQPIQNRVDMLSTGVRTPIGVQVFGPDLETIDRVCKEIEQALKPIEGARDVIAEPIMGKGYLEIRIDREKAARYGISVGDVQDTIEVALGGRVVTQTVEGRDRFPVRVRYALDFRDDDDAVKRLLVSRGSGMNRPMEPQPSPPPLLPGGDGRTTGSTSMPASVQLAFSHMAGPEHGRAALLQVPLSEVADVRIVQGPAVIKSGNGRLRNYVTLDVRGDRDIVGFVDEAQRVVAEKVQLPEGVHLEWSGQFEHQVRAARTLRIIFPVVILLIFLILYLTYHDLADAGLMMLAVPEALAGGIFFQWLFPKIRHLDWNAPPEPFSVAIWVGLIAAFGMATETGIIMLVYLREAIDKRGGLEKIASLAELREAVIEGAVHRLRPKLLTEGVAIVAIAPMLFATGVGSEIISAMALPVLGGLLIADEVVDIFLPVRFYWVRRARWLKLHGGEVTR